MKFNRIVYLTCFPFGERDFNRFGANVLKKMGMEVVVHDFSDFVFPPKGKKHDSKARRSVDIILKSLKLDDCVVTLLPYQWRTVWIFKALSKRGIYFGFLSTGSIFVPNANVKTHEITTRAVKMIFSSPIKLFRKLFGRHSNLIDFAVRKLIPPECFHVKRAKFNLIDGERALSEAYPRIAREAENIIYGHSSDYERTIEEQEAAPIPLPKPYVVFLDEFFPLHPDYEKNNVQCPVDPDIYYQRMDEIFTQVKQRFDLDIVIAAHPKSSYERYPNYFRGMKIIKGQTSLLVRDCQFVLAHGSTSINFAVIFKKPIIFCTMRDIMKDSVFQGGISGFADLFETKMLVPEEVMNFDFPKALKLNDSKYKMYLENYIKSPKSGDQSMWKTFFDEIQNS